MMQLKSKNINNLSVRKRIAGVVVLYNPSQNVAENINSYLNQIDKLYIVDNSPSKNVFILDFIKTNNKMEYVFNNRNLGVAAALNLGAAKALNARYSFLLTMDQDSKASKDMVTNMLNAISEFDKIGIISPFHINKLNTKKSPDSAIDEKLVVMTSGNLLNLSVYNKNGPFKDEFFIDYVDTEYCMRLNLNKFKVVRVNSALLYHNEATISKSKLFTKHVYPHNHSPVRMYFKMRNRLYLKDLYEKIFPGYFNYESPLFRNMFIKILLFEDNKIKKLKYALKGYFDYKKNIEYSPFDNQRI